ncbi:hypothetical protein [Chakrabartyella piscis]|uniref:hypothetical protein n=1 Tax=Chakrabartyella piscis TaxID=2918914 RepID=UPI002958822C|nr:hypothetical protein [Chakrabartyella piscis]
MYAKRKPLRLKEYDYSQNGAYFITICSYDKKPIFGEIHEEITDTVEQGLTAKDMAVTVGDFACKMMISTLAAYPLLALLLTSKSKNYNNDFHKYL